MPGIASKWVKRGCVLVLGLSCAFAQQRVITTVAGTDWLFPGDGKPALNAPLSGVIGLNLAVDGAGNYYIADAQNYMVMRVAPDGILNVIAGNGVNFVSGDGGLAVNAAVFLPTAVTVDPQGNVYIAEYGSRIRKVTPDGIITTFAGTGDDGYGGDGQPATQAKLNHPYGLASDSLGNIYIADSENNRVRKVTPDGIITTVAGNGQTGPSGDHLQATSVPLNGPTRIAVDSGGNLYIVESPGSDQAGRIRKVDANGMITTVAGGGLDVRDGVPATTALLLPLAVTVDAAGNLYIVDAFSKGVRKVDTQGNITTIAGGSGKSGFAGDGGNAKDALFNFQIYEAISVDSSNNILVTDGGNERIRKITPDGNIQTVAGNGLFHSLGDGGPATSATLDLPTGVTGDVKGNLYFTEPALSRIRKISPDGTISVYAGNGTHGDAGDGGPATAAALYFPQYLTFGPDGSLYFSDGVNCVIRAIDPNGIIRTVAGDGDCTYNGDGKDPLQTSFAGPSDLVFDSSGDLIIADTSNNRIRAVVPGSTGPVVVTIAGDGKAAFSGDGGDSTKAEVNQPVGLAIRNGGLYFSDYLNHRIRKIYAGNTASGLAITTVAGNGSAGFSGDGGSAIQASLNHPAGIDFDSAGNLYIADSYNGLIREVSPSGTISTFAGSLTASNRNDGGPATEASIGAPLGIYVAPSGDVFIADQVLNRVRAVLVNPPSFQVSQTNLAFTAPAGSSSVDQHVDLAGSIPGVPFTASGSADWLHVSPSSGSMPSSLQVSADPSILSVGQYQGTIKITAPNAQPPVQTIQVELTATAPGSPSLDVKPLSLDYSFVQNSAVRARALTISNLGGGSLEFTATATVTSGSGWLTASPGSGSVGAFGSEAVDVTANPAGLAPGTYSGTVTFASTDGVQKVVVPVNMIVTAVPQTILIPQSGLTFFAVEGGGAPPPQYFNILNTGVGEMAFTTHMTTTSGGPWLSAFPSSGAADASSPVVPQIRVDVDPQGLKAGIYYGTAQVIAATAGNNPQFVSVILNVLPAGSKLGPLVTPAGMIFKAVSGGEAPGSQTVTVQSTDAEPVAFTVGSATANGQNWLTVLPPRGTITPAQPARIVVQPNTKGLAPGVYRGMLTFSFSDGSTRNVAVLFVVIPAGSSTVPPKTIREAQSECSPKALAPLFTLLSSGFTVPAGFPGQVAVEVVDDCGNSITGGNVTVSFSNGDAPLRLVSLKDGNWAGTWTPAHATSPVTVTADAAIPEQNLKGETQIRGSLQSSDSLIVGDGGIVSAASFAAGAPLAPGSFISVFGLNLADRLTSASSVPLPTTLDNTSVLIGGRQAPLYFASNGQVNALVPYGIAVNATHQVIVSRGSTLSVPQAVTFAAAVPAIYTVDRSGTGQGIILEHTSQKVADAANPVHAGQAIEIYCTGLGEVNPPVPAGSPTPLSPLTYAVIQPTVTIGGVSAQVLFAGLTPGSTGLYQVNVIVPDGVAPGDNVSVVMTSAGQQSKPVTIAVQ